MGELPPQPKSDRRASNYNNMTKLEWYRHGTARGGNKKPEINMINRYIIAAPAPVCKASLRAVRHNQSMSELCRSH